MTYKIPESALVVIYDDNGRVLVLQRQDDADFWQSVTGTLETDEVPMQTAYREVKEETGIDIIAGGFDLNDCRTANQYAIRPKWRHRYAPECKFNTEYVFSVRVRGDEKIKLTEHTAYHWLTKSKAIEKVWSDTNKLAIQQFVPDHKN